MAGTATAKKKRDANAPKGGDKPPVAQGADPIDGEHETQQAAFQGLLKRALAAHERRFGKLDLEPGAYSSAFSGEISGDVVKGAPSGGGKVTTDFTTTDLIDALLCAPIIPDLSPAYRLQEALTYMRGARVLGHESKRTQLLVAASARKEHLTTLAEKYGLSKETPPRGGAVTGGVAVRGSVSVLSNTVEIDVED